MLILPIKKLTLSQDKCLEYEKKTRTHHGALIFPKNLIKFQVYFHFNPGLFENKTLKIKFANVAFLLI